MLLADARLCIIQERFGGLGHMAGQGRDCWANCQSKLDFDLASLVLRRTNATETGLQIANQSISRMPGIDAQRDRTHLNPCLYSIKEQVQEEKGGGGGGGGGRGGERRWRERKEKILKRGLN